MDSADLFITKPGGLSTAEASVKGLPMILDNAVSGCEQYNLEFFCRVGAAVTADDETEIARLCVELLGNEELLEKMSKALVRTENAAEQIAAALLSGFEDFGSPEKIENDFVYWRERCKLSQSDVSKIIGIPRRTLRGWESGESEPPAYIKRLIIAELKRISRRIEQAKDIEDE